MSIPSFVSRHRTSTPALPAIRPARLGDVTEITAIARHARLTREPLQHHQVREWLECWGRSAWVAELERCVCGFVVAEDCGCRVNVAWLAVLEHRRRQGIGRQLIHAVISAACQTYPEPRIVVEVAEANLPAQLLLRDAGFRWTRTRRLDDGETYCFVRGSKPWTDKEIV